MNGRPSAPRLGRSTLPAVAVSGLLLGGCALLPGGGSSDPEEPGCWIRVRNNIAWGIRARVVAPDGCAPIVFDRDVGYFEREAERVVEIPCGYRSALVQGRVSRISGLPGMHRTRFRLGICLMPGDTVLAALDEYGAWNERWFEHCPDPGEAASGSTVAVAAEPGDGP